MSKAEERGPSTGDVCRLLSSISDAKRILYLVGFAPTATRSFDYYLVELSRGLRERGWEVVLAFSREPSEDFKRGIEAVGARYTVIAFPFTWRSLRRLKQQLKGFRPQVTLTSFLSPFTWPLLAFRLFGGTGGLVILDHSSGKVRPRTRLRQWMARLRGLIVGRIIDRIAPVSNANALRAVADVFLPVQKVRMIHNGIALGRFHRLPRIEKRPIRMVYVGQLIAEKGVCTLLEAYRILKATNSAKVELLIAGEGRQDRELREFCALHGLEDVRFLGYISWVADLFSAADIVVVPSIWAEAFGLVAAEAMACGAATVVSDAGGLPEVVGDAGLVFRSGDANDLAARLLQLIESPELRARLGRQGRARVEEHFTLERSLRERIELCEEVLNERSIDAQLEWKFCRDEPTQCEFQRALEHGAGTQVSVERHTETAA